jgi:hypothetical protein
MSEQDAPMDALDRRLASYLEGRAEAAVAFGPGPDRVVASIAAGGHRFVLPGRRGNAGLRVPTLAWALLMMGLLAAMAFALGVGSGPDDSLVVLPPASPAPSVEAPATTGDASALSGTWGLDLEASGIDDTYGNPGARIARAERFAIGATLTLLDKDGDQLLVFYRTTDGCLWCPPSEAPAGTWILDFEASGIDGWYVATGGSGGGPRGQKMPVSSSIEFAAGVVRGGTGAGGGCDFFEGTYSDADGGLTIEVPDAAGKCGGGPVYPDLEVRQHFGRTAAWQVDGDELRLLDDDGALLLLYRRPPIDAP